MDDQTRSRSDTDCPFERYDDTVTGIQETAQALSRSLIMEEQLGP